MNSTETLSNRANAHQVPLFGEAVSGLWNGPVSTLTAVTARGERRRATCGIPGNGRQLVGS